MGKRDLIKGKCWFKKLFGTTRLLTLLSHHVTWHFLSPSGPSIWSCSHRGLDFSLRQLCVRQMVCRIYGWHSTQTLSSSFPTDSSAVFFFFFSCNPWSKASPLYKADLPTVEWITASPASAGCLLQPWTTQGQTWPYLPPGFCTGCCPHWEALVPYPTQPSNSHLPSPQRTLSPGRLPSCFQEDTSSCAL